MFLRKFQRQDPNKMPPCYPKDGQLHSRSDERGILERRERGDNERKDNITYDGTFSGIF